jgi:ADP-ribosyl-[dinitrogen reductase] hydrolase
MIAAISSPGIFHSPALRSRALGAYLGLATVEFMTAREIAAVHGVHREIIGGGWLYLKAGHVTDDTQMCLALGRSLLAADGWDLRNVADSFLGWMRSKPVDIGHTCRRGLRRYALDGTLVAKPADDSAGNGAAMRNLPLVLATLGDFDAFATRSLEQARITHHHPLSDAGTLALGRITRDLAGGGTIDEARESARELVACHPQFRFEPWPGNTTGFIVDTVQTVFDAFFTTDNFEACVVRAVNRGGDADTAGALAGQLAGACYGASAIPPRWLKRLDPRVRDEITAQVPRLIDLSERAV